MTATPAQRKAYLDALALGMTHTLAAEAACVSRSTPYTWREDPDFAAQMDAAMGSRLMRHFGTVTKAAQAGDWRASVWLLSILHPAECSTKRVEVSGPGGGPVAVDMRATLIEAAKGLTDAELFPEEAAEPKP